MASEDMGVSKFPYAAASTGRYLGSLKLHVHVTVFKSRVQCWEAVGPAREEFNNIIGPKLAACIKDNSDSLLDSECLINFSLFMIGRSAQRTKPTIMFVSEDKPARVEALRIVRSSGMLADHPGFESGHSSRMAELRQLRQLGGPDDDMDMSDRKNGDDECLVSIYSRGGRFSEGTQLFTLTGAGDLSEPRASATAGGILSFGGQFFVLTVAHPLCSGTAKYRASIAWDSDHDNAEDTDDSCEISGLEDSDDDDDLMVDATSRGSLTPEVGSDLEDAAYVTSSSSESQEERVRCEASSITEPYGDEATTAENNTAVDNGNTSPKPLQQIGNVVQMSSEFDYALVRLDISNLDHATVVESSHRLDRPSMWNIGVEAREVSVTLRRRDNQCVKGHLSRNRPFTLLPGTRNFLQLYTAEFEEPMAPGDCGSPVRDSERGTLFGHVVAGSKTSKLVLIMPAHLCFDDIVANFAARLGNPGLRTQSTHALKATAVVDDPMHASLSEENQPPSIDSTPEHKVSKPNPRANLPQGQCRYILLSPEIKGQRCACIRFAHNTSAPGTCDCGHLACFHERSEYDPSVTNDELNTLKSRISQLEEALRTQGQEGDALVRRLGEAEEIMEKSREEYADQIKGLYRNISISWRSIESLEKSLSRAVGKLSTMEEESTRYAMSPGQSESTVWERSELQLPAEKWPGQEKISDDAMGDGETDSKLPSPSHISQGTWTVHISLLPHPHMPSPFEKNTNAYQRCLSRGLNQLVAISGTRAEDFTTAVEKTFGFVLKGRDWAPMQTKLCTSEQLHGLTMLKQLAPNHDQTTYDAEFLRKYCAVCDSHGNMDSIYIAMKHYTLSWYYIRHLPIFFEGLQASWEHDAMLDKDLLWGPDDGDRIPAAGEITTSLKRPLGGPSEASDGSGSGSEPWTHDRKKLNTGRVVEVDVPVTRRTETAK